MNAPRAPGERRSERPRNRVRRTALDLLARMHRWAEAGWAPHAVALWSALQGSVVPGPSDALLVPLGLADPPRAPRLAVAALVGATVGGIVAYAIGALAFEQVGRPILHLLRVSDTLIASSEGTFARRGWELVLLSTISPLPTKMVCMAAGAFGVSPWTFVLALVFGRAARFAAITLVLRLAGHRVQHWAARYTHGRPPDEPAPGQ